MAERPANAGYLRRAHKFLIVFGGFYATFLVLLTVPWFQTHGIYMHWLNYPFYAKLDQPHAYGLAPNRALNVKIRTADGLQLGAWFVISDDLYTPPTLDTSAATLTPEEQEKRLKDAISSRPTILFFHGNAGNRATLTRPKFCGIYSTRLKANVLIFDYRGFADSEGTPSEAGLLEDARAVWDWLMFRGATASDVVLVGLSLGTGVASQFAAQLAEQSVEPRGLVLAAAFQSLPMMLEEYQLFGFIPILGPMRAFPFITNILFWFLKSTFDTQRALPTVRAPIIMVHAYNDADIPHTQSSKLFDAILSDQLPQIPERLMSKAGALGLSNEQQDELHALSRQRADARTKLISTADLVWADVQWFDRPGQGRVRVIHPHSGAHNDVLHPEGVVDYIGAALGLQRGSQ